jgi:hypothetical protein
MQKDDIVSEILNQIGVMEKMFDFQMTIFSIYRPSKNIHTKGLINAYGNEYFIFFHQMALIQR